MDSGVQLSTLVKSHTEKLQKIRSSSMLLQSKNSREDLTQRNL